MATTERSLQRKATNDEGRDEYALHFVPQKARLGRTSLLPAYWALVGSLVFLIFGALVALTIGTVNALISIAISSLLQGALYYALAKYSVRSGVTSSVFSRVMFGTTGSALAALLLCAVAVFYGALESSIIAVAFQSYVGVFSLNVWYTIVAVYSVLFVIGGIRNWLDRVNSVLLPLYGIGLVVAVVWAGSKYGFNARHWTSYKPERIAVAGPPLLFGIVTYMGVMILSMFAWDYSRMARERDTGFHRVVTFGPVYYFLTYFVNGAIGIFLVLVIPTRLAPSEISIVFDFLGLMGFAGLVFIWVSQTRINTANFYVASLSLESFLVRLLRIRVPRIVAAVLAGAIALALMLTNVFSFLGQALSYQAIFVVAWVGLASAHVLESFRRSGGEGISEIDDWRPGRVRAFNPGGLISWFAAAGLGVVLYKAVGGTWGAWSSPITFLVSFGLYFAWLQSPWEARVRLQRHSDVRDTVPDQWTSELVCAFCNTSFVAHEMDADRAGKLICAECALDRTGFYKDAVAEDAAVRAAAVPARG
jgi:purine-cytosine permease-like protein